MTFVASDEATADIASLGDCDVYYYEGSEAASWTLPSVSDWAARIMFIKNRSASVVTLAIQSGAGSIIWRGSVSDIVSSMNLSKGQTAVFLSTGTYWKLIGIRV